MQIWHICCLNGNPANGMCNVIPQYAEMQAKTEKVVLLNLADYCFNLSSEVSSFNITDLYGCGFNGLISKTSIPDIIVFHGIYLPRIWCFYFIYVKGRYQYVIVPHGSMTKATQEKNKVKKQVFNNLFVYSFTRGAEIVQFLSLREKMESYARFYIKDAVVENGVYRQKKHYTVKESGVINLTYVGRLDIYSKGLDMLLDACVHKKEFLIRNNVKLTIYGPDKKGSLEQLRKIIEDNQLNTIVSIYDGVFGEEKKQKLLEADYFIQCSRTEGMSIGILEALSYGIPLLITEGTNMGDMVRKFDCGVVAASSIDGIEYLFEEAVNRVQTLEKMSEQSLMCAENFYWDRVTNRTLDLYRKILTGK